MHKKIVENKKAAVFDLDGTLVETEVLWRTAFTQVFLAEGGMEANTTEFTATRGIPDEEKWAEALKKNFLKTQKTTQQLSAEEHHIFLDILNDIDIDVTEGFWELANIFKANREMKLGLTTNTKKDTAMKILEKVGADKDVFDFMLFGSDVKKLKPNPEIYIAAAKKLNMHAKDILVFEDSPAGSEAADKAGMDLVVVWDEYTPMDLYPKNTKLFISSFTDLVYNIDHTFGEAFQDYRNRILKGHNIDPDVISQTQKKPR